MTRVFLETMLVVKIIPQCNKISQADFNIVNQDLLQPVSKLADLSMLLTFLGDYDVSTWATHSCYDSHKEFWTFFYPQCWTSWEVIHAKCWSHLQDLLNWVTLRHPYMLIQLKHTKLLRALQKRVRVRNLSAGSQPLGCRWLHEQCESGKISCSDRRPDLNNSIVYSEIFCRGGRTRQWRIFKHTATRTMIRKKGAEKVQRFCRMYDIGRF